MTATETEERVPEGGGGGAQRRRRTRRLLLGLAALVVLAIAVVVATVLSLDGRITRVEVEGLGGDQPPAEPDQPAPSEATDQPEADAGLASEVEVARRVEPLTVLVLGSDSREVLTPEERVQLGTGMAWGERTEVVALVRLDDEADEIRMVNVPRDTVVTRCDGTRGRINAAYGVGERNGTGGMSCVVQTMTAWSGLDIDHVVKVDFRGFVDIVDAVGGVEMYLERSLRDQRANLNLQAGCQRLDGAEALAFVRARGLDNDFGRISRQQRLLVELRDQVREDGVFSEPVRTLRLAEAVASSLEVDSSLTLNRIRQLVMQHRSTLLLDLDARTVPGSRITGTEAWLLRADEQEAQALFTWLLQGDPEAEDDADGSSAAADADGQAPADDTDAPVASEPQRCG